MLLLLLLLLRDAQQPFLLPHIRRQPLPRTPVPPAVRVVALLAVHTAGKVNEEVHMVVLMAAAHIPAPVTAQPNQAEGKCSMAVTWHCTATVGDGADL